MSGELDNIINLDALLPDKVHKVLLNGKEYEVKPNVICWLSLAKYYKKDMTDEDFKTLIFEKTDLVRMIQTSIPGIDWDKTSLNEKQWTFLVKKIIQIISDEFNSLPEETTLKEDGNRIKKN